VNTSCLYKNWKSLIDAITAIKRIQFIVSMNTYTVLMHNFSSIGKISIIFSIFFSIRQILIWGIYQFFCTSVSTFVCVLTSFQTILIICSVVYTEMHVKFISYESASCCMALSSVL